MMIAEQRPAPAFDDGDLEVAQVAMHPDAAALMIGNVIRNAADHGTGPVRARLRPGPVLRAMFFVDFVTMLGSESAVHVYLSTLSPRSKRVLLLLILLIDTSTLVAMLAELPEGWAAAIGRVLLSGPLALA